MEIQKINSNPPLELLSRPTLQKEGSVVEETEISSDYFWDTTYASWTPPAIAVVARRESIAEQKEYWREVALKVDMAGFRLVANSNGCGACYFLYKGDTPLYVVKPVDEDIMCLNNRKGMADYRDGFVIRDYIPLYRSAQTDVMAYRIAEIAGISDITPKTQMAILESNEFYDFIDKLSSDDKEGYGAPDREKLCSIQEYVPDALDLWQVSHANSQDETIPIDPRDFERVNLLIWLTYDTDAHLGNILAYVKEVDDEGNPTYGLSKVDNGLSFPEQNAWLRNNLTYFPNAEVPLSKEGREKILNLDIAAITKGMHDLELDKAIPAFLERIETLKEAISDDTITLREINNKMEALHTWDS